MTTKTPRTAQTPWTNKTTRTMITRDIKTTRIRTTWTPRYSSGFLRPANDSYGRAGLEPLAGLEPV